MCLGPKSHLCQYGKFRGANLCFGPKSHLCQYGKFRGANLCAWDRNHTSVNMVSSERQTYVLGTEITPLSIW